MNKLKSFLLAFSCLVIIILTACSAQQTKPTTGPTSTPAVMPTGAGLPWHLVVVSDSSGWGLGEAYASQIEKDVGVTVVVDDFAIGNLSAGDVLDELRTGSSQVPQLEGLTEALKNADVVLASPSPMRSVDIPTFQSIQKCFGNMVGAPLPCSAAGSEGYTKDLEAIWTTVFTLRSGRPTILRGLDAASPFIPRWNASNIFAACTTCWECYSAAARRASEANGIPFLSRYDAYNGVNHDQDPAAQGYIGGDGVHPNGLAQDHTAELLSKLGYQPVTPP